jgi:hypothetical protein
MFSVLATTIVLGGLWIFLFVLMFSLSILVVLGTVLKRSGFFFRVLNALFDSQTRPLWVNQNDYQAARIAYFTKMTKDELENVLGSLESRLGVTRKATYDELAKGGGNRL